MPDRAVFEFELEHTGNKRGREKQNNMSHKLSSETALRKLVPDS